MCCASPRENDGVLPEMKHVAVVLRVKPTKAAALVTRLAAVGLIDNHGGVFAPHNWQRQPVQVGRLWSEVKKPPRQTT